MSGLTFFISGTRKTITLHEGREAFADAVVANTEAQRLTPKRVDGKIQLTAHTAVSAETKDKREAAYAVLDLYDSGIKNATLSCKTIKAKTGTGAPKGAKKEAAATNKANIRAAEAAEREVSAEVAAKIADAEAAVVEAAVAPHVDVAPMMPEPIFCFAEGVKPSARDKFGVADEGGFIRHTYVKVGTAAAYGRTFVPSGKMTVVHLATMKVAA